jgi:uncharacterized membrane protein YeiB
VATLVLLPTGRRVERVGLLVWMLTLAYLLVLAGRTLVALTGVQLDPQGLPTHPVESLRATSYGASLGERLGEWPAHTLVVLPFIMIVWLGMIAARRRLLEDAAAHRRLLTILTLGGLGIAFVGGLPLALVAGGYLTADPTTLQLITQLHGASGMFGGIGYVAGFGLIAARISDPASGPGRWSTPTRALVALGRRSLSGYLFQSMMWLLLLAPFTLHLAQRSPSPLLAAIALAFLVWLVTVWAADRLGDQPGPAERVLRRVTYGRPGPGRIQQPLRTRT